MKSILNGINKKDATLLLKALEKHANTYYEYMNGNQLDIKELSSEELDTLYNLTELLADKINIDKRIM